MDELSALQEEREIYRRDYQLLQVRYKELEAQGARLQQQIDRLTSNQKNLLGISEGVNMQTEPGQIVEHDEMMKGEVRKENMVNQLSVEPESVTSDKVVTQQNSSDIIDYSIRKQNKSVSPEPTKVPERIGLPDANQPRNVDKLKDRGSNSPAKLLHEHKLNSKQLNEAKENNISSHKQQLPSISQGLHSEVPTVAKDLTKNQCLKQAKSVLVPQSVKRDVVSPSLKNGNQLQTLPKLNPAANTDHIGAHKAVQMQNSPIKEHIHLVDRDNTLKNISDSNNSRNKPIVNTFAVPNNEQFPVMAGQAMRTNRPAQTPKGAMPKSQNSPLFAQEAVRPHKAVPAMNPSKAIPQVHIHPPKSIPAIHLHPPNGVPDVLSTAGLHSPGRNNIHTLRASPTRPPNDTQISMAQHSPYMMAGRLPTNISHSNTPSQSATTTTTHVRHPFASESHVQHGDFQWNGQRSPNDLLQYNANVHLEDLHRQAATFHYPMNYGGNSRLYPNFVPQADPYASWERGTPYVHPAFNWLHSSWGNAGNGPQGNSNP